MYFVCAKVAKRVVAMESIILLRTRGVNAQRDFSMPDAAAATSSGPESRLPMCSTLHHFGRHATSLRL